MNFFLLWFPACISAQYYTTGSIIIPKTPVAKPNIVTSNILPSHQSSIKTTSFPDPTKSLASVSSITVSPNNLVNSASVSSSLASATASTTTATLNRANLASVAETQKNEAEYESIKTGLDTISQPIDSLLKELIRIADPNYYAIITDELIKIQNKVYEQTTKLGALTIPVGNTSATDLLIYLRAQMERVGLLITALNPQVAANFKSNVAKLGPPGGSYVDIAKTRK